MGRGEPAVANFREELFLVAAHELDEGLVAGILMGGGPENHFGQHRREVHSLLCEEIVELAAIGRVGPRGNYAVGFELAEPVGEDIGGNAFVGAEEFLVGAETAEHHVADDEERPAIAEDFDGGVERAPGPAFGTGLFGRHEKKINSFCLHFASYLGIVVSPFLPLKDRPS